MLESEFLIYDRRAGTRHVQIAFGFGLALLLACLAILPWRTQQLPRFAAFIPVVDAVHLLFYGIIGAVLLSLASILKSRALIVLGAGYVFVGLMAAAHGLTYPETFSRTGLFGATRDSVTWLFFAWHLALPAAVIVYARLKETPHRPQKPVRAPGRAVVLAAAAATAAAVGMTWLATAQSVFISVVLDTLPDHSLHYASMLLCIVSMTLLWRRHRSILDLALMLTLWAWLLEFVLVLPGAPRFGAGWYAGRMVLLLSGLFVLLMLLIEMSRLYARTIMLIASRKRERDTRLMMGEAVGAFIAHELRQPLAAISLNAYTAQKLGVEPGGELAAVLDDLVQDSRRANDVIESTRALFGEAGAQKRPTDLNQLIRDTLLTTALELKNHGVQVEVMLDDPLPPVAVNRTQMQQVFVNLFLNAAQAMSGARPRQLTVRSGSGEAGLVIRVEDTGPSIPAADRERIVTPFFTTRKHGTGMGLSICRSVVLAHGGSIRMAPGTPQGAAFEIRLPVAALPAS